MLVFSVGGYVTSLYYSAKIARMDLATAKLERGAALLKVEIAAREKEHAKIQNDIVAKYQRAEADYDSRIAAIAGQHAGELRKSQARIDEYRRLSEAGSGECRELSAIAERYDRVITDGRGLAARVGASIGREISAIDSLLEIIKNDREIVEN